MDERQLPFYVIGHNPNTLALARSFLEAGANALEPDIQRIGDQLWVSHDASPKTLPFVDATPLGEYLVGIANLAREFPSLALIVFDSKLDDATSGAELHAMVRTILAASGLTIVFSVGSLSMSGFLQPIAAQLDGTEAVMVDEEPNVAPVFATLTGYGAARIGYGDGIMAPGVKQGVTSSLEAALAWRAMDLQRRPQFIEAWTLAKKSTILDMLRMGVDGVIVNLSTVKTALALRASPELDRWRPLARRNDPLFLTTKGGRQWLVEISTLDRSHAGTDAKVTITLGGSGPDTITRVVDASYAKRFESGMTTQTTVFETTDDVGTPQWVSLVHDGTGNAPDWLPDRITVRAPSQPVLFGDVGVWIGKGTIVSTQLGTATYALTIQTSNRGSAGTDADITFVVTGTKGTVRRRINGNLSGWFESGDLNTVDIRGADIGTLQSLRVENDGSGSGAGWHLAWVTVAPDTGVASRTFTFTRWVNGGASQTST